MVKPPKLTEPASLSSDTSGRTRIEMRPSLSTVGVKARPTPYCLYSMVVVPRLCWIGIGNSPPARKLAVSPERAVRRSEEHTSELQSLMRNSYAVFCLKKKTKMRPKKHNKETN